MAHGLFGFVCLADKKKCHLSSAISLLKKPRSLALTWYVLVSTQEQKLAEARQDVKEADEEVRLLSTVWFATLASSAH